MIYHNEYSIDEVFRAMDTDGILPDGEKIRQGSLRMLTFRHKGTSCANCGKEANVFILEAHIKADSPHANLYYRDSSGKLLLFTKDHIMPRSKGGRDILDNMQTMCMPCNSKKGSKIPEELMLADS